MINLSTFAGLLYRKHPETDVKPVLCWAVRALSDGGEPAMAAGKVSEADHELVVLLTTDHHSQHSCGSIT